MPKAVVLFSGGQDSATCLAQACADFDNDVVAVGFDYGQRHSIELKQAKLLAETAEVPYRIIDLNFISQLTPNALTDSSIEIDHKEGELPSTFVPGRNLFFISVGAVIARQLGAKYLYTGVCQTDYSGYPDCRDDFVQATQKTVNLAMETDLEIRTPLMWLTKAETVILMKSLGKLDWYKESHTCYEGARPACGQCPACELRLKGFQEAGIQDPLEYA
jgi:7-cyano-7-deazaguanine synthase